MSFVRVVFWASDDILYWGGINGFNSMSPFSHLPEPLPFAPVFVGFSLFGESWPLSQDRSVTLDYDQYFFLLEFSALNYIYFKRS